MYIYGGRDDGADTGRDAAPPPVIGEQGKLVYIYIYYYRYICIYIFIQI